MTVKIEIKGAKGYLTGVPQPVFEEIYKRCQYFVDGAENSDAYIKGRWDGYRRLLDRKGIFMVGMLDRITGILDEWQQPYEIESTPLEPRNISTSFSATLRPYQQQAIDKAKEKHRGVIQVATGGGKTVIASGMIHQIGQRTLFMVHTKDLLYQALTEFRKFLGEDVVGQLGDGVIDIREVTVATTQTLAQFVGFKYESAKDESNQKEKKLETKAIKEKKALVKDLIDNTRVLIWDEVHRIACSMAIAVAEAVKNAEYRIGLSASPWRDDGADMEIESAMGSKIYVLSATDLIDMGFLVRPIIRMDYIPSQALHMPYKVPYPQLYRADIVNNNIRNDKIIKYYKDFTSMGIPTLILVKDIKHGNLLKERITEEFDPIDFLSGRNASKKRNDTIQELRDGERIGLIASVIADEGLDIKRLGAVILAGGGKSSTRALQRVGRAIRPFEGKDKAFVVDFVDQHPILRRHSNMRMAMYRTEPGFVILEL